VAAYPLIRNFRFRRLLARLCRDADKGQAALQFALIAPAFFLLLMGTIEAGVIFFAQSSLQNAVN
jgi:Flp pilus assembly protein TadG